MLPVEERILLLDEVASTALSSWQIHLLGHERFAEFPEEHRQHPACLGHRNVTNLLSMIGAKTPMSLHLYQRLSGVL